MASDTNPAEDAAPIVILLHGLWRTKHSMQALASHIEHQLGFKSHSLGYHTFKSLQDLAESTAKDIHELADGQRRPVYAVTHSMGAVVLRHIMELPNHGGVRWAGCCMLAPPNHGSSIARSFNRWHVTRTVFRATTGRAGAALADELATCSQWPAPPQPCGVVAGTVSLALFNPTSWMTRTLRMHGPRANDGTVAVAETLLPEGQLGDFVTVRADHTFIMHCAEVKELVVTFLQHGSFGERSQLHEVPAYREELKTLHPPSQEAHL